MFSRFGSFGSADTHAVSTQVVTPRHSQFPRWRKLAAFAALFALPLTAFAAVDPALTSNITVSPSQIAPGDPATLTILLVNNSSSPATPLNINQALPAGLVVVSYDAADSTCGGADNSSVGTAALNFQNGTVPAITGATAGQCQIVYVVTSNVASTTASPLSVQLLGANVTDSVGTSKNDATWPLTVLSMQPLGGNKGFNPATPQPGATSTLTINVNNPNTAFDMPGVAFSDDLSSMGGGVTAIGAPTASGCGSATPTLSGTVISISGADIAPASNCTITVTVTATTTLGTYTNTIPAGAATSTRGSAASSPNPITAQLTVTPPAGGGKSFTNNAGVSATTIEPGSSPVLLQIDVTNTTTNTITNDLTLTDNFPDSGSGVADFVLSLPGTGNATTVVQSDTCGFTNDASVVPGGATLSLTGGGTSTTNPGGLAAGGTCTVKVWVQANQDPTFVAWLATQTNQQILSTNTIPPNGVKSVAAGYANGQPLTGSITIASATSGASYNIPVDKLLDTGPSRGAPERRGCNFGASQCFNSVIPPNPATTPVGYETLFFANGMQFSVLNITQIQDNLATSGFANAAGLTLLAHPGDPLTFGQNTGDTGACNLTYSWDPSATGTNVVLAVGGQIDATKVDTAGGVNQCWVSFPVYLDTTNGSAATWPGNYADNIGKGLITGTAPTFNTGGAPSSPATNGSASNTTVLSVLGGVNMVKSFANTSLGPGGTTALTVTLNNTAVGTSIVNGSFPDILPAGMTVASPDGFSSSCSGGGSTPAYSVSGQTVTFTGIDVAAAGGSAPSNVTAGTCAVNLNVTVTGNLGTNFPNTIAATALTDAAGITNPLASNTANVLMTNLAITSNKRFNVGQVLAGQSAVMTVHIANSNGIPLTQVKFTDLFTLDGTAATGSNGMVLAGTPDIQVTCTAGNTAGTVTPGAGGLSLIGSGFTLAPNASGTEGCDITANVQLNSGATVTNTIPVGGVSSFEGAANTGPIQATLISVQSTAVTKSIAPATVVVGQPATVTVRVSNSTGGAVGPIGILDQINPSAGYPAGVIPASPTYVAQPNATWQIVSGSVALSTATGGTDGSGAGCTMSADTTTAGGANDQTQLNAISVPANTFCDVTYQVKASAVGLYRNAILQANVTPTSGGPNVCFPDSNGVKPTPCFTSADLNVTPAGSLAVTKTISGPGATITAPNAALAGWIFTVTSTNSCDLSNLTTAMTTDTSGVVTFPALPVFTDATQTTKCAYSVAESGGTAGYSLDPASASGLSAINLDATTPTQVTANNIRASGSLTVTKNVVVTPSGGPAVSGTFTVNINCGADGTFGPLAIAVTNNTGVATQTGLPAGATCTIIEDTSTLPVAPANYSWGTAPSPSYSQPGGPIDATTAQTATVTNNLIQLTSDLTITKTISGGPSGGLTSATAFTFTATCAGATGSPFSGTVSVTGTSGVGTITGIPAGSNCSVAETVPAGASAPQSYIWGAIPAAQSITTVATAGGNALTFVNNLIQQVGTLTVSKTLSGGPAGYSGSFPIVVSCSLNGTAVTPTEGNTQSATATSAQPGSVSFTGLPQGSTCTVSEGTPPAAPQFYSWAAPVVTPPSGAIGATPVTASIANALTAGDPPFNIVKTVAGGPATFTGSFTFNIDCGAVGTFTQTVNLSGATSGSVGISNIPAGTTCTFSESLTDLPAAPKNLTWGAPPPNQTKVIDGTDVNFVNNFITAPVRTPALNEWMLALLGLILVGIGSAGVLRRR